MRTDPDSQIQPDPAAPVRASRFRVARSRGALSGVLLVLLGLWAALVPFFGPSFDFTYAPSGDTSWHWTAARAWFEVLPGAVAVLGGLLLLLSANRIVTIAGAWLGAAAGAWLVIAPAMAGPLSLSLGTPNPASGVGARALESILYFYGIGAAMVFFASVALGRLSVHGLMDVRAAERRAAAEEAAARAEQERAFEEHQRLLREAQERDAAQRAAERDLQRDAAMRETAERDRPENDAQTGPPADEGRHAANDESPFFAAERDPAASGRRR